MKHKTVSRFFIMILSLMVFSCGSMEDKKTKYFEKGNAFYEKGDYVKARMEFKNAIQIDPRYAEAYYMLGMVEYRENEWKRAVGYLSKAVYYDPDFSDAQVALGDVLLILERWGEAAIRAEIVLSRNPEHEGALLLKAGCLITDQKYHEAEQILESLIKRDPEKTEPYFVMAKSRMEQKDPASASRILRDLLFQDQQNQAARLLLAETLEKNNDLSAAEKEYINLIRQNPENHDLELLLAKFYVRNQKITEAERILKKMVMDYPEHEISRLHLARLYYDNHQYRLMIETLRKTIKDMPKRYKAYEILAGYFAEKKDFDNAIEIMDRFLEKVPAGSNNLKSKLFKAEIFIKENKHDDALHLVNEVIRENPADLLAHRMKGNILLVKQDYMGAIAEFRTVLKQEPGNITFSMNLARAHFLNGEPLLAKQICKSILEKNPTVMQARFALVDIYRQEGNIDRAKDQLEEVLRMEPDNRRALLLATDIALLEKETDRARNYSDRLLALDPDSPHVLYRIGLVRLEKKNDREAFSFFEEALKKDPDFVPALDKLINHMAREKNLDAAIARCRRQIAKRPKNSDYYVLLGKLYAQKGDDAMAGKNFQNALEINSECIEAFFYLARLEQATGSIDQTIENYEKLRRQHPENLYFALIVATLFDRKGEYTKAKDIYREVLDKNPNISMAANNLAFYYAEHEPTVKNLAEAERLIKPLLKKFDKSPYIMDTAAWIYYQQGNYEKAGGLLPFLEEKAARIPDMSYRLGMIYLKLGEKMKAREHLWSALNSRQFFYGKEDAIKVYNTLEHGR